MKAVLVNHLLLVRVAGVPCLSGWRVLGGYDTYPSERHARAHADVLAARGVQVVVLYVGKDERGASAVRVIHSTDVKTSNTLRDVPPAMSKTEARVFLSHVESSPGPDGGTHAPLASAA